jgi:hypothetical protein
MAVPLSPSPRSGRGPVAHGEPAVGTRPPPPTNYYPAPEGRGRDGLPARTIASRASQYHRRCGVQGLMRCLPDVATPGAQKHISPRCFPMAGSPWATGPHPLRGLAITTPILPPIGDWRRCAGWQPTMPVAGSGPPHLGSAAVAWQLVRIWYRLRRRIWKPYRWPSVQARRSRQMPQTSTAEDWRYTSRRRCRFNVGRSFRWRQNAMHEFD